MIGWTLSKYKKKKKHAKETEEKIAYLDRHVTYCLNLLWVKRDKVLSLDKFIGTHW